MLPAAGMVLVATPWLADPNFAKTVIYLLEHGERGTMGVIINRSLPQTLGELWSEAPPVLAGARIAADGGPVAKHGGLILHGCTSIDGAQELLPGLAAGGDTTALLERFIDGPNGNGPRLFLGHSGWGKGQLERELESGSWQLRAGRLDWVFNHGLDCAGDEGLWGRLCHGPDPRFAPSLN